MASIAALLSQLKNKNANSNTKENDINTIRQKLKSLSNNLSKKFTDDIVNETKSNSICLLMIINNVNQLRNIQYTHI